jgi:hypothetical protein
VYFENAFHTGSKYDVVVLTVSFPFPQVKFLFVVTLFLSGEPFSDPSVKYCLGSLNFFLRIEQFFSGWTVGPCHTRVGDTRGTRARWYYRN